MKLSVFILDKILIYLLKQVIIIVYIKINDILNFVRNGIIKYLKNFYRINNFFEFEMNKYLFSKVSDFYIIAC